MSARKIFTISLIAVVSLLLLSVSTVSAQIVGNDDVFGATSTKSNRRAMPFTMPEDGTIQSITIKLFTRMIRLMTRPAGSWAHVTNTIDTMRAAAKT